MKIINGCRKIIIGVLQFIKKNHDVVAIFVSLVAIGISIYTNQSSNKIALFEQRYDVYRSCNALIQNASGANNVLRSSELEQYLQDNNSQQTSIFLYFTTMDVLMPNANISELPLFQVDHTIENSDLVEAYTIVNQAISDFCIELDSAKYMFSMSNGQKSEVDSIISKLQNCSTETFILSGADNVAVELLELTELIVASDFIDAMRKEITL